jgi:Ni,Fe-hydrogenase I small subunit
MVKRYKCGGCQHKLLQHQHPALGCVLLLLLLLLLHLQTRLTGPATLERCTAHLWRSATSVASATAKGR